MRTMTIGLISLRFVKSQVLKVNNSLAKSNRDSMRLITCAEPSNGCLDVLVDVLLVIRRICAISHTVLPCAVHCRTSSARGVSVFSPPPQSSPIFAKCPSVLRP
jgi:hypothetical protein